MEETPPVEVKELHTVTLSAIAAPFAISWSEDNKISVITTAALHVIGCPRSRWTHSSSMCSLLLIALAISLPATVTSSNTNITASVFGSVTDLLPAAFGDFNSDELTDLFTIRNGGKKLEIFLAADQEPLLRSDKLYCVFNNQITSVVPGDFDGDTHMDVLVTTTVDDKTHVHISWGGSTRLNCSDEAHPLLIMHGQPLAVDYNHDVTADLFGLDTNDNRMFWIFHPNRTSPTMEPLSEHKSRDLLRNPHSHAFLDINGDYAPDLYLSTKSGFEIWLQGEDMFTYNKTVENPPVQVIGQSLFVDLELEGYLQHVVPVCFDIECHNTTLYVYHKDRWHNLNPNFKDTLGKVWGFVKPDTSKKYIDTMTLRAGDFNMDGYPDLLATLSQGSVQKAFLLVNVACQVKASCEGLSRTFAVNWDALNPLNEFTSTAIFYDMYQDGILDVILATQERVLAFRNTLDYDANFVKVMVLAGQERGSNLPGPRISYRTTTQEGNPRAAVTVQLPQSAHFSLGLPYSIFGLGRTPNFVDTLTVGVGGWQREWTQIIPNSQMVVIPYPPDRPSKWRARLFVTPSNLILLSVAALTGTCGLIVAIIASLYLKERREDRIEKLQEAHRFHFDAM